MRDLAGLSVIGRAARQAIADWFFLFVRRDVSSRISPQIVFGRFAIAGRVLGHQLRLEAVVVPI